MRIKIIFMFITLLVTCIGFQAVGQGLTINGPDPVCVGSTHQYDVAPAPNSTYQWKVNNKGFVKSHANEIVTVTWGMHGTGEIKVYEYDASGTAVDSGVLTVNVLKMPAPKITTNTSVNCKQLGRDDSNFPPNENFDSSSCIQVCAFSCVMYYAAGGTGSVYSWTATGGTVQENYNDSALICWNGPGYGKVTVKETNTDGCEGESSICVKIIDAPIAKLRAMPDTNQTSITVCDSSDVIFVDLSTGTAASPIFSWYWDFGDGTYSSAQSSKQAPMTHKYTTPGVYWAKLTVTNKCGCSTTDSLEIIVDSAETIQIVCPRVVCEGDTIKYEANPPCSLGTWSAINGRVHFQNYQTADIIWDQPDGNGYGYVIYDATGCDGMCATTMVKVPVIEKNAQIQGPQWVCPNSQYIYKMPQWPTTHYTWTIAGAGGSTLKYGEFTNEVVLNTGSSTVIYIICNYYNTLLQCGGIDSIEVNIMHPVTIDGPREVCHKSSHTFTLVHAGGAVYNGDWTLVGPGGTQSATNSNTFTPTFSDVGDYILSVTGPFCAPDPIYFTVRDLPPIPDFINGPDSFCKGVPTKFEAGDPLDGTLFAWAVLNGTANAPSGDISEITMNPASAGPFEIYLWRETKASPFCRSDSLIKQVYPPNVNLAITGKATPCINSVYGYHASYENGETYEWKIENEKMGSVVTGQNTHTAHILWNNATGMADVICRMRRCDSIYIDTFTVNIGGVPTSSLTAPASVCANSTFNVSVTNAESVNFNFDDKPTIWHFANDNMDYVFKDNQGATRTVTAKVKLHGCQAETTMTATIVVDPAPAGTIAPSVYTNCGSFSTTLTYSQPPSPPSVATSFQWYYNGTAIPGPNGTSNPITINTYGWYWVEATDASGCTWTSDSIPVLEDCPCQLISNWPYQPYTPTVTLASPTVSNCNEIDLAATIPSSVPFTPGRISTNWRVLVNSQHVNWVSQTATTAKAVVDLPGSYLFEYEVAYQDSFGTICSYKRKVWALVPYAASFKVWHTCDDSSGWRYTLISNASTAYTFLTFKEISIDGNVVSTTGGWAGYLSPGTHTIKIRISDGTHGICELEDDYEVVWPNADFDWERTVSCEEEATVEFTNLSVGAKPVLWDFGDGAQNKTQDPYRVYEDPSSPYYDVTLWIEDPWGCRDSITKQVEIVEDKIEGDIEAVPTSVCQGQPVTLRYIRNGGTNFPASYTWYNQLDAFATTTYQPITVYESGYYWIYVEDNSHGCYDNTDPVVVTVTKVPQAFIIGDSVQCQDVPYTLSGYAGNDPGISYQWLRAGTPITGATGPTLTDVQNVPNTSYPYQVIVTVADPSGGTCSDTSDVFTVDVYPNPTPPNPVFNILDCDLYQVELSVVPANPGAYNWSNGAFGSPAYSYNGGSYQVTYTDTRGCKSSATMYVPEDPRMHLWVFPTGCYTICPRNNYIVVGNYVWSFDSWDYRKMGGGFVHMGTGQMIPDYTTLGSDAPGTFNLALDNGYCRATSDNMYVDTSCETGAHLKPGRQAESLARRLQQRNDAPDAQIAMGIVPNPASQSARIDYIFNEQSTARYIEVYDMTGRVIGRHRAAGIRGSWQLSLEQYTPGIYQVVLKQDGRVLLQNRMSVVR